MVATFSGLSEAQAHAIAGALEGPEAVDISESAPGRWRVTVYFEMEPSPEQRETLAQAGAQAAELAGGRAAPAYAILPETNWVARSLAGLAPVRAGRFVVHGSHDRAAVRGNEIGIEIEAGLAFGTGHHGTTTGCLLAIGQAAATRPVRSALDLGTGTGVLAIAIARVAGAPVIASDIDPVAVKVAAENVRLNGAAGRVRCVVATGAQHPAIRGNAPYDLIAANILAGPLVALAPAIRRHLAPRGVAILSGILAEQKRRVAAAYRAQGLRPIDTIPLGEWVTLVFERP